MGLDAFSVSLSLGMQRLSFRRVLFFSMFVGLLHSLFPYIGLIVGSWLKHQLLLFTTEFTGLLFMALGLYMIIFAFQQKTSVFVRGHWFSLVTLSVLVSIDSLSIGFGISFARDFHLAYLVLFAIIVMMMTLIGVMIGKRVRSIARTYSELIGGLILLIIGILYYI